MAFSHRRAALVYPWDLQLMGYAELYCQSNFSFLKGGSHPEELVLQAHSLGYQALALTDECSVAGVVRAYRAIKEHGLGLKLVVGSLLKLDDLQLVALCPSRKAYGELCRVISNARRRCNKGHYALNEWDLSSLKHCLLLWLPSGKADADDHWGAWLGKQHRGRIWLGLTRHLSADEDEYHRHCQAQAGRHNLSITACGGVLMHCPERLALQQVLTAIRLSVPLRQAGQHLLPNAERCLRRLEKLARLYPAAQLAETLKIAGRCEFSLGELRYEYPAELVPEGLSASEHLRQLVEAGIKRRFGSEPDPEIRAIIEKELKLIAEQAYEYFFLTIHDIVCFAQKQGILYQGRGSAANSIVCYCLEITAVDPRQISVLFERFISKERNEPPDIDVDFEHERREEVIQYIYAKYGRHHAALAATVISYRFKSAIRDVGKALGIQQTQLDFFIKHVNRRDSANSWQSQLVSLGLRPEGIQGQQFIALVEEIMGFPRHLSQHVGGFIISSGPLYELVPVENAAMAERTVIQWDKDDLETLGLLKVDILALGMLSAIRKAFGLILQHHQRRLTVAEITRMGDDEAVFRQIQQADTLGVFQIESRAQMSMLPRLRPNCYYDLVVQIAIVRPGPIQGDMVHPYLRRRAGSESVSYPSEAVKAVLIRTLGVPIFQEQVIKLAMVAAGFTGGEADQLRRAMAAWKRKGGIEAFRQKLINGMAERGYAQAYAERLYEQICGFGEYGFPESHSASFAVLAYVSAWLKHYYPACFYCALLNSQPMGFYSPSQLVQDARRHGIEVRPVCVNRSEYDHHLESDGDALALRLGLRLVKGVSRGVATALLNARQAIGSGGFTHMGELQRLGLGRHELAALASADAFKDLGHNRYQARWEMMDSHQSLPLIQQNLSQAQAKEVGQRQRELFQVDERAILLEDYAATGLSLSHHPIALLAKDNRLGRYTPAAKLATCQHKQAVTVVGVVTGRQSPGTAAGVTFMTLEDDTGNSNVVVWRATARGQQRAFLSARLLRVTGILEREGQVIHVIAGRLEDLSHELEGLHSASREFH